MNAENSQTTVTNKFGDFYNAFRELESYIMPAKVWLRTSKYYELTRRDLLDALKLNPELRRAYKLSGKRDFCVLEVKDSENLPKDTLKKICASLRKIGVDQFAIYKDIPSGDVHIYIYFLKPVSVEKMNECLNFWLNSQGAEVRDFAKFVDGPIPIPCQNGFAWIDEDAIVLASRIDLTELAAVSKFLDDYETKRVCADALLESLQATQGKLFPVGAKSNIFDFSPRQDKKESGLNVTVLEPAKSTKEGSVKETPSTTDMISTGEKTPRVSSFSDLVNGIFGKDNSH